MFRRSVTLEPGVNVSRRRVSRSKGKRVFAKRRMSTTRAGPAIRKELLKLQPLKKISFSIDTGAGQVCGYQYASTFHRTCISPNSGLINIVQGVGEGERIGNKIRIKRVLLKATYFPMPYDAVTNSAPIPTDLRVLIVKEKGGVAYNTAPAPTSFFNLGSSVSSPTGDLRDQQLPVNNDLYVVKYDRKVKLGTSVVTSTGTSAINQQYANNDYKMNQQLTIDVTKMLASTYDFNDNTGNPQGLSLWWCTLLSNCNNTGNIQSFPVNCSFSLQYEFYDA